MGTDFILSDILEFSDLSDASGNGGRKFLQRRETHTTHVDFQFWEEVDVRGTHVGAVGRMG